MSSSFIYNIRKYSGDPFSLRWKKLSEKIAEFESRNAQVEQPDFLNEQLIDDSRLRFHEIAHTNTRPSSTIFYLPFEPDLLTLTCWLQFEAWANIMTDSSLMGNDAHFVPAKNIPSGIEGPTKGFGGGINVVPSDDASNIDDTSGSVAMMLDGETQSISVYDKSNIQLAGTSTGISIAALIFPRTFNPTDGGMPRYIVSKVDNATNYFGIWLETGTGMATGAGGFTSHFTSHFSNITIGGGFTTHFTTGFANITAIGGNTDASGVIHFWIFDAGVDRSVRTIVNVLELEQWAWITCTFNQSNNVALIYVNGLPAPTVNDSITDGTILAGRADQNTDMHVFGGNRGDGFFYGGVSDFRLYREKVLTAAEVFNLDQNMMTISNIAIGNISKTGFSLIS
jgi:hypothetical protein